MARYRMGVEGVTQPVVTPRKETVKIPHVKSQRTSEGMTDGQKEGVRLWNLMRQTLLDNNLMERK